MYLLVFLGNYGKEYEKTRHNYGFMLGDSIMDRYCFDNPSKKFASEFSTGDINGNKCLALKPQTYMNRSGIAVSEAKKFYKIPIENIFVFHDDLDLKLGQIKEKVGGGAGGHNGLKSIDEMIGKNYNRIRLGTGRPEDKKMVHDFVLGKFTFDEKMIVDNVIKIVTEIIPNIFTSRENFLTEYYLKIKKNNIFQYQTSM